jgi:hypothetical protein
MNFITQFLPNAYRQGNDQEEIAIALTQAVAEKIESLKTRLGNYYADYINPATCDPLFLDAIAESCGWGEVWDSSWSIAQKRQLLINTNFLWENRGNKSVLYFLFETFSLDAKLEPQSGFILNVTTFPGFLNADPFSYIVRVPATYSEGTPELRLVKRLIRDFMPCWVSFTISPP